MLVVTHEHELVHRFHQRVVTLKNGRIISDIPADPEAIAARSAELNAWKDLTEPVDDEPDEQNDETKERRRRRYEDLDLFLSDPARPAQSGQALGYDHCLHRVLSVCMTLNSFASLAEVNVDSMVSYLAARTRPWCTWTLTATTPTATQVGETLSAMPGVSGVQYVSKQDVLNIYRGYMEDYSSVGRI